MHRCVNLAQRSYTLPILNSSANFLNLYGDEKFGAYCRRTLGSNPGPLHMVLGQSDALTTRLDLIRTRLDLIRTRLDLIRTSLDLICTMLDLIRTRLDLFRTRLDLIRTRL
jgi:hypothetical protein